MSGENLVDGCRRNPVWAAQRILDLEEENKSLRQDVEELEGKVGWLEEHGPNCECRECKIPGS